MKRLFISLASYYYEIQLGNPQFEGLQCECINCLLKSYKCENNAKVQKWNSSDLNSELNASKANT